MKRIYFPKFFWFVAAIATLAIGSKTYAQPTELVTVGGSYNSGGYSNPSLRIASIAPPVNLPAHVGENYVLPVNATNVVTYAVTVDAGPQYEVVINGVARRSATFPGLQDGNGNSIPGTKTDQITICVVPTWRSSSAFHERVLDKLTDPTPLGSSGPVTWGVPIAGTQDDADASAPRLEMNMGLAKNGMPLPPLKARVEGSGGLVVDEYPLLAGISVVGTQINGDTMKIYAPQVTATVNSANKSISFAVPGSETTPFLTYSITGPVADTANQRNIWTVTKTYAGASVTYVTKVYEKVTTFGPGGTILSAWTVDDWHDSTLPAQRIVSLTQPSSASPNTTGCPNGAFVTITDAAGNVASRKAMGYQSFSISGGDGSTYFWYVPSVVIADYQGNNYTTTYLLGTRGANNTAVVGESDATGKTVITQYTPSQLPGTVYSTWLNSSPSPTPANYNVTGVNANGAQVTSYLYTADWNGLMILPSSVRTKVGSTLLSETTNVYTFNNSSGSALTINGQRVFVIDAYAFAAPGTTGTATTPRLASDGTSLHTKTITFREDADDSLVSGLTASIEKPDGTKTSYAYERGTLGSDGNFTVGSGSDVQVTRIEGLVPGASGATTMSTTTGGSGIDPVGVVAGTSTATVEIWRGGFLRRHELWVNTAGTSFTRINYSTYSYTSDGRLLEARASDGNSTSSTWTIRAASWDGDRKTWQTDAAGLRTDFTYDAMGRIKTKTQAAAGSLPALKTTYGYDAETHITATIVGPDGGELVTASASYDKGGLISHETDVNGVATDYTYTNGGRVVQVTVGKNTADQTDRTTTLFTDGRTNAISGSAVVYEQHSYDVDSSNRPRHTVIYGSSTGRSVIEVSDLLDRLVERRTPGFGATGTIIAYHDYNNKGLLARVKTVLSSNGAEQRIAADHITDYDAFGAITADGIDLNPPSAGFGTLDASSTDRFATISTAMQPDANNPSVWWNVVTKTIYTSDNSSAAYNQTKTYTQLNPAAGVISNTVTYDFYGNAAQDTVTVDTSAHSIKHTVKGPTAASSVTNSVGGAVLSTQDFASDNLSAAQHSTTYSYDAQGRRTSVSDSRTGAAVTNYEVGKARASTQRNAVGSPGAIVASFTYDNLSRTKSVTDANGSVVNYKYNGRGEVTEQSGTGTYPSGFDYNEYGEKTAMRTYRNGMGGSADTTSWTYDANTGWLTAKTDAAGHQVSFNYTYDTVNGWKIATRTWARGVTTTSRYNLSTGELKDISYSDGTPGVTYTYTRDGRVDTVNDVTGLRDFAYDHGQISAEALSTSTSWYSGANGGANPGLVLTPVYESSTDTAHVTGRYAGYKLGYATAAASDLDKELSASIGYDTAGRVANVSASYKALGSRTALSVPFTYQYYGQSSLWQTLTQVSGSNTYQVSRTFEPNRDVLSNITSLANAAQLTGYAYQVNTVGQRQWAVQSGTLFSDFGNSTYFQYGYDTVGQLQSATGYLGADPTSTAKPLPGRDYRFTYDTIGNRLTAKVDSEQVAYSGTNALNQYGSRGTLKTHASGTVATGASVTVNTSATATQGQYWDLALPNFSQYTNVAVSATLSGQTANLSIPTAFRPATESFSYDADGNLTDDSVWHYTYDAENRLIEMAAVTNWGAPSRTLTFKYDYLGRRVQKTATGPNSGDNYTRRFVYQSWALVAEIDGASNQIVRSYLWGVESGGAGGGDLVLEVTHTSTGLTPYRLAYDGNANVAALLGADGSPAAVYEYDPYGQLLRREGTESANNPFRYGGYYTDQESGLVYYGHRFYDPTQGRFINRDPSEESGGINLYGFVANSPSNRWDRLGLGFDAEGVAKEPPVVLGKVTVTDTPDRGSYGSVAIVDFGSAGSSDYSVVFIAREPATDTKPSATNQTDVNQRIRNSNQRLGGSHGKSHKETHNGHEFTIYEDGTVVAHTPRGDVVIPVGGPPSGPGAGPSAYELGFEWLSGLGDRNRLFLKDDKVTKQIQSSPEVMAARKAMAERIAHGNYANYDFSRKLSDESKKSYVKGFFKDLIHNPTRAYLGTYDGQASVLRVTEHEVAVMYRVTNSSSLESATRLPPPFGYTDLSDGSRRLSWVEEVFLLDLNHVHTVGDLVPKSILPSRESGELSTTSQTIVWFENIYK